MRSKIHMLLLSILAVCGSSLAMADTQVNVKTETVCYGDVRLISAVGAAVLYSRLHSAAELRATTAAGILVSTLTRVVLFGATGLLAQDGLLVSALMLLPCVFVGLFVGQRLHDRVRPALVLKALYALLLLNGLSLLARYAFA